jgi:hypothetical protein
MATITAILMSYKRKPNMPKIVESYRRQNVDVEVWMINNNGNEDFGADKLISIPWNAGEMARYLFCARPDTDYVCFQDDDFLIKPDNYLETAIELVEQRPQYSVGASGRNINWENQEIVGYYAPEAKRDRGAAILKGHFQAFRRDLATQVHIMGHFSASDIWWGLDISQGAPAHLVSGKLAAGLTKLDQHDTGLEFRPDHWSERSAVVESWMRKNSVKPYWWNDGRRDYGLYPEDYQ